MTPDFEFYIDGLAITIISTFGIIGTLMSLRVLLKQRNSFSSLLSGLAISDTFFLFFAVLIIGLPKSSDWYTTEISVYVTPVAFGFMGIARTASVYCTICVTLERYVEVSESRETYEIPLHNAKNCRFLQHFWPIFNALGTTQRRNHLHQTSGSRRD